MNDLGLLPLSAIVLGTGATITFDLWARILKFAFGIPPSNMCLVGRWLRYMPEGTFMHENISASLQKKGECIVGWIAHYVIGIAFAMLFITLAGNRWLQDPTWTPAVAFGIGTALAPFFVMQPLFGLGVASSKAPNPTQARLRTLFNHMAFGAGLYLVGTLINR